MRIILIITSLLFCLSSQAQNHVFSKTVVALSGAIAQGAGSALSGLAPEKSCQAYGTTTAGAGAATVAIQASNDNSNWITVGTITLVLATAVSSDGFAMNSLWRHIRANVTAISGTGASVTVICAAKTKES